MYYFTVFNVHNSLSVCCVFCSLHAAICYTLGHLGRKMGLEERSEGSKDTSQRAHRKYKMVKKEPGRAVVGSGVVSAAGLRREFKRLYQELSDLEIIHYDDPNMTAAKRLYVNEEHAVPDDGPGKTFGALVGEASPLLHFSIFGTESRRIRRTSCNMGHDVSSVGNTECLICKVSYITHCICYSTLSYAYDGAN